MIADIIQYNLVIMQRLALLLLPYNASGVVIRNHFELIIIFKIYSRALILIMDDTSYWIIYVTSP